MLWMPSPKRHKLITNQGLVGTVSPGTALPGNATTLLDGAVTELISAANNTQDSWGISIGITATGASATASECCCDILIGGATDDVFIAALLCGNRDAWAAANGSMAEYFFPVHIPGGVRIAATLASVRTSITARIIVRLYSGSMPPFKIGRKVTTLGTQVNNSRGVATTPAASGGTALATQMIASTAEDYFYFFPGFQIPAQTTINLRGYNIGIGVGASTEDRIGTWDYSADTVEAVMGPFPSMGVFQDVPSGTRITSLSGCSGTVPTCDTLVYAVS